jgi:hypothetical protein
MTVEPPVKNQLERIVEFEEDSDFVPEEIKELRLATISPPEEMVEIPDSTEKQAEEKNDVSEVKNFDPALEEKLLETQSRLSEQERINGLLTTTIVDMIYRQMADMPNEIQVLVLSALIDRVTLK